MHSDCQGSCFVLLLFCGAGGWNPGPPTSRASSRTELSASRWQCVSPGLILMLDHACVLEVHARGAGCGAGCGSHWLRWLFGRVLSLHT